MDWAGDVILILLFRNIVQPIIVKLNELFYCDENE
jgi:hypothetical protein